MFRKILLLSVFLIPTCILVCAKGDGFTAALKSCSAYSSNDNVNILNMNVLSSKNIAGWQNDKCVYREDITFMNIKTSVVCRFSQAQINELASVINSYEFLSNYSGEAPDFSSFDTAQNNPVSKAWSKYLQDTSVCSVTTNQSE